MRELYSTLIFLILVTTLPSCVSVKSTADYYIPYTTKQYPAKTQDAPIPILGRPPERPHKVIGRLAFSSDMGWRFMRQSMLYNARIHGADAVWLKNVKSREEVYYTYVPPSVDWVPVAGPVIVEKKAGKNIIRLIQITFQCLSQVMSVLGSIPLSGSTPK